MSDSFSFSQKDIRAISKMFRVKPEIDARCVRFEVGKEGRRLSLEIYPAIRIGSRRGSLVSVYTSGAHLQLHFCSGYVISRMLGEVTFVGENNGKLSGLIVEKEGGCSLYANVDRSLLSGDYTSLGPEVMMSGVALSLTDAVLEPEAPKAGRKQPRRRRSS
jgi:hypothetical protein